MDKVKQEEIDFLVNWFENASFEEIEEVFSKKRIKAIIMKEKKFDPIIAITDGKKCEDICKHAPPENKFPCVDCDMRCHDRAEPKHKQK